MPVIGTFSAASRRGVAGGLTPEYRIARSLRFNSADSAYLSRTPGSAGNRKTWTWSGWVKRGKLDASGQQVLFSARSASSSGNYFKFGFYQDNIRITDWSTVYRITSAVYRDPTAHMHVTVAVDTTHATGNSRIRLFIGPVEITAFGTLNNPSQNTDLAVNQAAAHVIGAEQHSGPVDFADGLLSNVDFVDGLALDPSYFGKTDLATGQWVPKKYAGSYGTNGFYLDFSDNSNTTSSTLGADRSGNGNDWTPNNFSVSAGVGNDSLVDAPTNFGTDTGAGGEVRGDYCTLNPLDKSSTGVLSNGNLRLSSDNTFYGVVRGTVFVSAGKYYFEGTVTAIGGSYPTIGIIGAAQTSIIDNNHVGVYASGYAYMSAALKYNNNSSASYGATFTTGDVIGVALDMDSGTLEFFKNGASQGVAFTGLSGDFAPAVSNRNSGGIWDVNFGQQPFAYAAPTGFKALCTQNFPAPAIKKPRDHFDVVLATGTNIKASAEAVFSGSDFLEWIKSRESTSNHQLIDTVRGLSVASTYPNNPAMEGSYTQPIGNSVGWVWKESPAAGFDIVSYTGNAGNQTLGHNLGVPPALAFFMQRNSATPRAMEVYHRAVGAGAELRLNSTTAATSSSIIWQNTAPDTSSFYIGNNININDSGLNYVAYLFAEIPGFSKFGSYTGNANADGPCIYCDFRPRWLLIKRSDSTGNWLMYDTARDAGQPRTLALYSNLASVESTEVPIDFLANGFKIRSSTSTANASGGNYVFAAFADAPLKYARAA